TGPVADQAAGGNEATPFKDCGDDMAGCQRYELFTPGNEERVRLHSERTRSRLGKGGQGPVDLGPGGGLQDLKLHCMALMRRAVWGWAGFTSKPSTLAWGTSSDSSSSRLGISSAVKKLTPVRLPPGRARLVISPAVTGSPPITETMGIVAVAVFA